MPMVASNKADLRKFAQLHNSSGDPNNVQVVRNGPLGNPFEALSEMRNAALDFSVQRQKGSKRKDKQTTKRQRVDVAAIIAARLRLEE